MMIKYILTFLVFTSCLVSCRKVTVPADTESSAIIFFGGNVSLELEDMEPTADGGFIFSGSSATGPSTGDLGFLLKTDSNGKMQWLQRYGGKQTNGFTKARQTADGGFIAVGYTCSFGNGPKDKDYYPDGWMVKTDANGNMQWQKSFGDIYLDTLFDVKEMADHGFVAVGKFTVMNTYYASYTRQFYLLRTNISGDLKWGKAYFNTTYKSIGQSLDISPNGDIIASGIAVKSSLVLDQNTFFPCLVRVNANNGAQKGTTLIFNNFTNCNRSYVVAVADGYVMAANNDMDSLSVPYLIKSDFSLNMDWQKQYPPGFIISNIGNDKNGGLNLSGTFSGDVVRCSLIRTDASGNIFSNIEFGNSGLNTQKFYPSQPTTINILPSGNEYAVGTALSNISVNSGNIFALIFSDQAGKIIDHVK